MATYYIDPQSATNGAGTENDPKNTFVGITWGANSYLLKRGSVLSETITIASASVIIGAYGTGTLPIIDCGNTRSVGINFNGTAGATVSNIKVINQNAATPNAAFRVSGSNHDISFCEFSNCQLAILANSSSGHQIHHNYIDVGNPLTPGAGWGIRLNGVAATNIKIYYNTIVATGQWRVNQSYPAVYSTGIELYGAVNNTVHNNILSVSVGDQIILRQVADGNTVRGNVCFGKAMLDGIDVLYCNNVLVDNNTVVHLGDVSGHQGPCFAVGDDYGTGSASTNVTVRNNVFRVTGNLCMSIRPAGAGLSFKNNLYYRTGASNTAIVNYDDGLGGGFVAKNYTDWMAVGLDTDSIEAEPEINSSGVPQTGSPLIDAGLFVSYNPDAAGVQRNNPPAIGAYEPLFTRASR